MFADLFLQQLHIVSRRETDESQMIRQVFHHFDRAGADGAGRAEKDDVLHQCVSTWRRYKYMSGALNRRLSIKSRIPPMPGNQRPESFTLASRLKIDSIKSPTTAAVLSNTPRMMACIKLIP